MPATLFANIIASLILVLFANEKANAPLKTSPAPVVSITFSFKLWDLIKKFCLVFAK